MKGPFTPKQVKEMGRVQCSHLVVSFSDVDGSITYLENAATHETWQGVLASYKYQTYSTGDYAVFAKEYTAAGDFQKQGMETAKPESKTWKTKLLQAYRGTAQHGQCKFVMQLVTEEPEAHTKYGAPHDVSIEYTVPGQNEALADISLFWANKSTTRLA